MWRRTEAEDLRRCCFDLGTRKQSRVSSYTAAWRKCHDDNNARCLYKQDKKASEYPSIAEQVLVSPSGAETRRESSRT